MSLADTMTIMPSVASMIRTGYSNLSNFSALAKPTDMTSVTTAPMTVSTFMNRENGSATNAPAKPSP